MKRIKYLIGLLICFLFVSTGHGQVKEIPGLKMSKRQARLLNQVYDAQMNKEPVSAAAFAAAASIDHGLADGYCEDAAPVLMTPTFSGAPLTGGYWLSQDGSSEPWVNHTTGEFVPENVPSSLHGNFISCTYVVEDALGNPVTFSDYTKVFSLPDASYTLGGDTEICQGQTGQITLSGSSGSVMYHLYRDPAFGNSPSLVASTPGNSDGSGIAFNVSVEGRYTIKAEEAQPDVTCENDIPGFIDLVVNTLPSPLAANGGDVCLGGDIQLFGDPDGLNVYTWTNASGTEIGTSQDISFSSTSYGVGTHEFTLTVENAKGCVNTATTSLTVTENPSVAPSYNAPVCDGGSLVISANASGGSNTYITYTWTKGGTIIPGETGATLTIDPAGVADSDTYGVIVEDDNGCTSIEETVVVTIQALPVPTINGDANETSTQWCEGEDITLTGGGGSPGATYAWLLPNGDTQSTAVLTVNNADKATYEGTYTLTVTEGTCVNSLDHTVVINPKPEPIAANGGDVCLDEDISLTGNPDDPTYTYTWTNAGGTIIGTTKDITISSTPYGAGTHEFTLTIEDGNGCTESAITNVTVYNNPIVSPSYNLPVCDGGSLVISANASGGSNTYITYTWTKGGTIIPGETGATLTIDPAGVADSDTYGVIVEDDNGCTSIEETVVVTIQALPVPTINGDANETSTQWCEGEDITLTGGGGSPGATYAWLLPNGDTQSTAVLTVNNADKATYEGTYTLTVTEGTCVNSLDHTVVINPKPEPIAANGGDVCLDEDISLIGNPDDPTYTYTWTNAGGSIIGTAKDIAISSTPYGAGTHEFTLTIEDGNGCTESAITNVTVYNNPIVSPSYNLPVCDGGSLVISANASGGSNTYITYTWTKGGAIIPGETGATLTIDPAGVADSDTYGVIVEDDNGCTSIEETVVVTIQALPVPTINGDANETSTQWCEGEDITLTGGGGSPGATYAWLLPNGDTQSTAVLTVNNADKATYEGTYTLTVTEGTCVTSLNHNVVVDINPDALPSNGGDVCLGDNISLIGNPAGLDVYTWTNAGGTVVGTTQDVTVSTVGYGVGTHVFTLTVEDDKGCSGSATTSVDVNTVDATISVTAPSLGATTICSGTPVTFNGGGNHGSGNYTYEFHRIRGAADNVVQPDGASPTYVATGVDAPVDGDQFYVVVTDTDTGCTDTSDPITINVVSNPVPTLTITNNGGSPIICEDEQLDFEVAPADFARYEFSINGTPVQDGAGITFSYDEFVDGDKINVTAYTDLSANACYGTSTDITIQVNDRPSPAIDGDKVVCINDTKIYTANVIGLGKGSYTWIINGGTPTGDTDEESVEVVWGGVLPYSISLNYVNGDGCEASTPAFEIITGNVVTAGLSADKTSICSGEDVTFTATGGDTYEFYIDGTEVVGHDGSDTYVASGLTDGQIVTVRAIDAIGCEDTSDGITITVVTTPSPSITSGPAVVCNGDEVIYETQGSFVDYVWSVSGGGIITDGQGTSKATVKWNSDGAQSISVTYSSVGGTCVGPVASLPVTVIALPSGTTFSASPSNNVIIGTDITFTASGGSTYSFLVNGSEVQARSTTNTLSVSTEASSTYPIVVAHNDVVRVNIFNDADCSVFEEVKVGVYEGITPFDVIASASGHCYGETIEYIQLSGFQPGITYELFRVATPEVSMGKITASAGVTTVKWEEDLKGAATPVEYRVEAYYDGVPPTPAVPMSNTVFIEEYADLLALNMSPTTAVDGKGTCGTTQKITLGETVAPNVTDANVNYQLLVNGTSVVATLPGNGGQLDFGSPTLVGTYTINAVHATTGCEKLMNGDWEVEGLAVTAYNLVVGEDATSSSSDGRYCENDADGVHLWLQNSESYTYELWIDGIQSGTLVASKSSTGGAIDFGSITAEGRYEVAINDGGCYYPMANYIDVQKVSLPVIGNMTIDNSGHYCANDIGGAAIVLDSQQDGIVYRLFRDNVKLNNSDVVPTVSLPLTGDASGAALNFGSYIMEGTYFISAEIDGLSACRVNSNEGDIVIDPLPEIRTLEGDTEFCEGDVAQLYIVNPEESVDYELLHDEIATGDFGTVSGSRLEWTVTTTGIYTIQATKRNTNTDCGPSLMPGELTLIEVKLPEERTVAVIDGDISLCEGTIIKVIAPEASMQYSVVSNITNEVLVGYTKDGTDVNDEGDIEFAPISDNGGSYRVEAYNGACPIILDNTGSGDVNEIIINNPNAVARKELVAPASICDGDGSVSITIRATDIDVNYNLYRINGVADVDPGRDPSTDAVDDLAPITIIGDGSDRAFDGILNQGTYYVLGYNPPLLPTDECSNEMLNRVTITFNQLPISYRIVGSGISCGTDNPAVIGLEGSQADVEYTLVYDNPSSGKQIAQVIEGNGSPLSFDGVVAEGDYTVYARSITTGCTSSMEGTIVVSTVNQVTNQDLTKTNYVYCSNDLGAELVLLDQEFGVLYEVRDVSSGNVVVSKVGDAPGSPLVLGVVSTGTYEIWGSYNGACTAQMNNGNAVNVSSEPTKPLLDPSIDVEYCYGEEGIDLSVTNTMVDIGYQLINNDGTGDVVSFLTGNGGVVTFPNKVKGTDTYRVTAISFTTGCSSDSDPITITEKDELHAYDVILAYGNGDSNFDCTDKPCYGLIQVDTIKLDMSMSGVNYMLMRDTEPVPVKTVTGTGNEISFGVQTKGGEYYVMAYKDDCTVLMSGTVSLAVEPLEAVNDVTGLPNGEAIGEFNVAENDRYLANLDYFPDAENDVDKYRNLTYELITSWDYLDEEGVPQMFNTIGEVSINESGKLEYKKLPNFFGRDSVRYRVTNTMQPDRHDEATVFVFVGNVSVGEEEELLIPNAFSPNGDGMNDTYVITGTFVDENTVSKLEVFNRWGTVVYRSKGDTYGENDTYWDGRANAGAMVSLGDLLPSGTYFYVFTIDVNIDGKIETKEFSGFIELRR